MDKPVGSAVTYTQFLNSNGGVESDLTVTRLGEEYFWVITGSGFIANDLARLQMHADEADGEVTIRDITQEYACLALWGPRHGRRAEEGDAATTSRMKRIRT
jgi:glycine cleavage system aminomethyltransferase T